MSAPQTGERAAMTVRVGIDLGGTKIEVLALSPDGAVLFRRRVATPRDYSGVIRTIAELVTAAEGHVGERGTVGIGAPGSLSPATGLWRNANIEFCNGRDLPGDLAAAVGREVRVENDANCFVLSEATDGAGASAWTVYGVTAGTGLGGGMVVGKRLNRGANGAAGETGHVPLPWLTAEDYPLPPCYCGLEGCAEQYLSGTGLAREFTARTGRTWTSEEIMSGAAAGDIEAAAAAERFYDRFARFLSVIVNIMDPDVIVVGGGLSTTPGFSGKIAWRVPLYTFARDINVRVLPAHHGDASGVRGAAWLWNDA